MDSTTHILKVVVMGTECSGKTSFCTQVAENYLPKEHIPTIGVDLYVCQFVLNN